MVVVMVAGRGSEGPSPSSTVSFMELFHLLAMMACQEAGPACLQPLLKSLTHEHTHAHHPLTGHSTCSRNIHLNHHNPPSFPDGRSGSGSRVTPHVCDPPSAANFRHCLAASFWVRFPYTAGSPGCGMCTRMCVCVCARVHVLVAHVGLYAGHASGCVCSKLPSQVSIHTYSIHTYIPYIHRWAC